MPNVGGKKFSYTPEGVQKAREHSAKTGIPMETGQRYNIGGLVKSKPGKRFKIKGSGAAVKGNTTLGSV